MEFHLDSDILDGASRVLTNERVSVNRRRKYFHHDDIVNARLVYNRDGSCRRARCVSDKLGIAPTIGRDHGEGFKTSKDNDSVLRDVVEGHASNELYVYCL